MGRHSRRSRCCITIKSKGSLNGFDSSIDCLHNNFLSLPWQKIFPRDRVVLRLALTFFLDVSILSSGAARLPVASGFPKLPMHCSSTPPTWSAPIPRVGRQNSFLGERCRRCSCHCRSLTDRGCWRRSTSNNGEIGGGGSTLTVAVILNPMHSFFSLIGDGGGDSLVLLFRIKSIESTLLLRRS